MTRIQELFTEHPRTVGETYGQHLMAAWSFAGSMLLGGLACAVHGLLPFLFVRTASTRIGRLYQRMMVNRSAPPDPSAFTSESP
jgi:hypothetical protein